MLGVQGFGFVAFRGSDSGSWVKRFRARVHGLAAICSAARSILAQRGWSGPFGQLGFSLGFRV